MSQSSSTLSLGGSQQSQLMAISEAPSFNYTSHKKDSVAGYTLTQVMENATNTAKHTTFNGTPAYLLAQTTQPTCQGDASGRGGGVKSGTIGKEVKPTSGSSTIFVAGKALVREGDSCTMNNGNVTGTYISAVKFNKMLEEDKLAQEQQPELWVGPSGGGGQLAMFKGWAKEKLGLNKENEDGFPGGGGGGGGGGAGGSWSDSDDKPTSTSNDSEQNDLNPIITAAILSGSQNKNEEDTTTFYHGTTIQNAQRIRANGIDLSKGEPTGDFGQGFYMTKNKEEALSSADRKANGKKTNVVRFDVANDKLQELDTLIFTEANKEWQDFTRYHKLRAPDVPHGGEPYDMVTGPLVKRVHRDGSVSKWPDRTDQTSIHTEKAVELFNQSMQRD